MRHAAALSAAAGAPDFERPLSSAGRASALQTARRLSGAEIAVDRLLYSPARRTRETAEIVAGELGIDAADQIAIPELYGAGARSYRKVIEQFRGEAQVVMVIGHNPGISEFGQQLRGGKSPDQLQTAGFWRLPLDGDT
jgi:phosphohistidine phosphatase